jgi:methionyl aminopeptidase
MTVENDNDLQGLMAIGRICGLAMHHMAKHVEPGMTTGELDAIGAKFLEEHGAESAPIKAYNFPGHTCISVNDEAAHGIPGDKVIQAGDLVNIDVSAVKDDYWADTGMSMSVPPFSPKKERLLKCTRQALDIAISNARAGNRVYEIGRAVEKFAHKQGYNVLHELGGHGVGRHIHESPTVPNHYNRRARETLQEGMVVTLEPFLTMGSQRVTKMRDGWTLKTHDGSLVAQYEHTIVITDGKPILVTAV